MPTAMQKTPATAEELLAYLGASASTEDLAAALTDVVLLRRRCVARRRAAHAAVGT